MATNLAEPKQSRVTIKWYVVTRKYHSRIFALVTLLWSRTVTLRFLNKPAETLASPFLGKISVTGATCTEAPISAVGDVPAHDETSGAFATAPSKGWAR